MPYSAQDERFWAELRARALLLTLARLAAEEQAQATPPAAPPPAAASPAEPAR